MKTVTRTRLTSDAGNFRLRAEPYAYHDDTRVVSLNDDYSIPPKLLVMQVAGSGKLE